MNVLFITKASLKNPVRGTPLRIYNFIRQIAKVHQLYASAPEVSDDLQANFFVYPKNNWLNIFKYYQKIISEKQIKVVITATGTSIKLLVLLKLFCRVKIVMDIHGLDVEESFYHGYISNSQRIIKEFVFRFFLRFYDLLFTVSEKLKNYYLSVNNNIEVIYGGVNLSEFKLATLVEHDFLSIGYMGNTRRYQGLDEVIGAVNKVKENNLFPFHLNLVISGGDEDLKKIKNILDTNNLNQHTTLNFNVDHDKVDDIINQSDVLVLSRPGGIKMTEYAYPSKLPEYLATGLVTVTTDVGPVSELFKNAESCLVIPTTDTEKHLVAALTQVFKMSMAERQQIGLQGREFVQNNLTWDILGLKINQYLERLA